MTVRELKEKLNEFDDNLIIMIPNADWHPYSDGESNISATKVLEGVNDSEIYLYIL